MAAYGVRGGVLVGLTLAQLQALGTDAGVRVGARAKPSDVGIELDCTVAGASSSAWGYKRRRGVLGCPVSASTSADERWLNWSTAGVGGAVTTALVELPLRHPTRVLFVEFFAANDPGATVWKVYDDGALVDTSDSVDPTAAVPNVWTFPTRPTIAAHSLLAISYDPTNARTASERTQAVVEIEETVTVLTA
jgi:hypothetical protein